MDPRWNPLCIIFVFCINRPILCCLFLSSLKRTPDTYNRLSPHPPPRSNSTLSRASSSSFLRYSSQPGSIWEWGLLGENLSLLQRSGIILASYVKHIRWLFFFDSPSLWISGSHCIMREDSIRSEIGTGHGELSGKPPKNSWSPPGGFKKRENWGQYGHELMTRRGWDIFHANSGFSMPNTGFEKQLLSWFRSLKVTY